jgi:predicted nuclease of restriction endonuclease-like (RecB) superfamily
MAKKELRMGDSSLPVADESRHLGEELYLQVSAIIERRKYNAMSYANSEVVLMFWDIGRQINAVVFAGGRGEYGKKILSELSTKLVSAHGQAFSERNLYRIGQFAAQFPDENILSALSTKLSWSHFVELLSVKSDEQRLFYARDAASRQYGIRELRNQIARKAFERREIANTNLSEDTLVPFNVFKDPYLLDVLGLKENYLEADLEKAILEGIEKFILEFGHGFTFVDRQKRMIIDNEEVVLDLLFYHRILRRLVAVELKIGSFKAAHMGQMLLYLKWLNQYERQENEEAPIGIILCTSANRKKVELLEMDKSGIAVAEYWTHLPSQAVFEKRITEIMQEAKERLDRRKALPSGGTKKQIDYFIEPKDDEDE